MCIRDSACLDLPLGGRARAGPRSTGAAAQGPLLPLARLAQDRPQLRPAPGQPALRAAGERDVDAWADLGRVSLRLELREKLAPISFPESTDLGCTRGDSRSR